MAKQDFPLDECEILVCDDGSTEDLQQVVEKFKKAIPNLRLLNQQARGPASARNLGFRSSLAQMFVCVDSDVVCDTHFLSRIVEALREHPEWVAAEGHVIPREKCDSLFSDVPTNEGGNLLCGATAYRAQALRQVGGFDEGFKLPSQEDFEIGIRLMQLGEFGFVPDAIVYHPMRRVTLRTFWGWRRFWKYTVIIGKRYGVLGVPKLGKRTRFPRLRVAICATITLPVGRFSGAISTLQKNFREVSRASFFMLFDVLCGIVALPEIVFCKCPERQNYLKQ